MPEIVIVDIGNVTVDGVPVGSIFDLSWNRPQIEGVQSLALAALQSWVDSRDQAQQSRAAEALAAKDQSHAEALATKDAMIADLQSQVEALGGTELGQRLAAEARRQAALAKMAEAQAELDAINGVST